MRALAVGAIVVACSRASAQELGTFWVGLPNPHIVGFEHPVAVDVGADAGVMADGSPLALIAYQITVSFDTAALELVDVERCAWAPSQYSGPVFTSPANTETNGGWLSMTANGQGVNGPLGAACLATIRFRSRNQTGGSTSLSFARGRTAQGFVMGHRISVTAPGIFAPMGVDLPEGGATIFFAPPPVSTPGDVTGDSQVDVFDLVTLAAHIVGNVVVGQPPFRGKASAADLDGNGLADVFDVVRLARVVAGNPN